MNRNRAILGLMVAFVIVGSLIYIIVESARAIPRTDPDFLAIQATLRGYADIKDEARYTLDDSRMAEFVVNDLRGGLVDPHMVQSVRVMTDRPDLKAEDVGLLDAEQARYAFERKAQELFDQAVASGALKIIPTPTDNAILPTPFDPSDANVTAEMRATDQARRTYVQPPDIETVPAIRELEQATGLVARLRRSPGIEKHHTELTLLSVSIDGDVAYAKVEWEYGLCEDILVKINGRWYLAGHRIIKKYAGLEIS